MTIIALGVVLATGLYLVGLGVTSLVAPEKASLFLLGHASSAAVHYLELALRLIVGWALLTRAPFMSFASGVALFGWVLVITTIGLLVIPWRWHNRFAQATVPSALRYLSLIGVASIVSGSLLLAVALQGGS